MTIGKRQKQHLLDSSSKKFQIQSAQGHNPIQGWPETMKNPRNHPAMGKGGRTYACYAQGPHVNPQYFLEVIQKALKSHTNVSINGIGIKLSLESFQKYPLPMLFSCGR